MRIYTAHLRSHDSGRDQEVILVKEGFSWPALLFSVVWALWHRMWLVALGLLAFGTIVDTVLHLAGAGGQASFAVNAGVAILVGCFGNDLRRWTLERRGFISIGMVAERDRLTAERRLFEQQPELTMGTPR